MRVRYEQLESGEYAAFDTEQGWVPVSQEEYERRSQGAVGQMAGGAADFLGGAARMGNPQKLMEFTNRAILDPQGALEELEAYADRAEQRGTAGLIGEVGAGMALSGGATRALRGIGRAQVGSRAQRVTRALGSEFETKPGFLTGSDPLRTGARKAVEDFNPYQWSRNAAKQGEMQSVIRQVMQLPDDIPLNPGGMKEAGRVLGQRFGNISSAISRRGSGALGRSLKSWADNAADALADVTSKDMDKVGEVKKILYRMGTLGDDASGKRIMGIRTDISDAIKATSKGKSTRAREMLLEIQDKFDDSFLEAAGPDLAGEYQQARKAYRYWKALGEGKNAALDLEGNINPVSMVRRLARELGRNADQDKLFRMAQEFATTEATGANSNTAIRSLLQNAIQPIIGGGAAAGGIALLD